VTNATGKAESAVNKSVNATAGVPASASVKAKGSIKRATASSPASIPAITVPSKANGSQSVPTPKVNATADNKT
jgi:hypothetical protein